MSWALKGESDMNESKWKEAIDSYKKALELDNDFLQVRYNLALCENQQAISLREAAGGNMTPEVKQYLQNSIDNLLIIKEKDPNREMVNWAYTLYQAYYLIGDEAKAKELESLVQ
jgi:tetratricopeptide (TPR) repeat protein